MLSWEAGGGVKGWMDRGTNGWRFRTIFGLLGSICRFAVMRDLDCKTSIVVYLLSCGVCASSFGVACFLIVRLCGILCMCVCVYTCVCICIYVMHRVEEMHA